MGACACCASDLRALPAELDVLEKRMEATDEAARPREDVQQAPCRDASTLCVRPARCHRSWTRVCDARVVGRRRQQPSRFVGDHIGVIELHKGRQAGLHSVIGVKGAFCVGWLLLSFAK